MPYAILALAIACEVVATTALKASLGFTRLLPSLIVVVGYGAAFFLLSLTLKTFSVGFTYAVWSGLGIVLVALMGAVLFGEKLDAAAFLGMGLIIAGVVVLNFFSRASGH
ncbi:multidrug efflux SMR transporter [Inquilinus sp. CAU 1745]|uniref:DMT family transporter n=1 Tax=Inquilinus sp. CAU 1745 TaxID=3140369 RepID=UPI00325B55CA